MNFDWLSATRFVRPEARSAKAQGRGCRQRPNFGNLLPSAWQVFWGQDGDLLLVIYLRFPARGIPENWLKKLCEAGLHTCATHVLCFVIALLGILLDTCDRPVRWSSKFPASELRGA